jgi:hypothetical protein
MPDDTRPLALVAFTNALWRAWTKAGPPSYKEFEKRSEKVLGRAHSLSGTTVHGVLRDLHRQRPPRWPWVHDFWTVLRAIAAEHGIDPDSLGTLAALKRLHEAADPAQRPAQRLTGAGRMGSKENALLDADLGHEFGPLYAPGQRSVPIYSEADVRNDKMLASIRRKVGVRWWHSYQDVVPAWFGTYLSLEPATSLIRVYDTAVVPGLLQTEAYANAVLQLNPCALPAATIARTVELRMSRQQLIGQPNAPTLWAVLDESALRRRLGGTKVMRGQLRHLIDICAQPNVTIQVNPSTTNIHATPEWPIALLRFRVHEVPDVVYIEQFTGAFYLYTPKHIGRYTQVLDSLAIKALKPDKTIEYLNIMLRDLR